MRKIQKSPRQKARKHPKKNLKNQKLRQAKRIKRIKEIIDGFAKTLAETKIDDSIDEIIEHFHQCKGKIITTGMGKAGIAMKKFSSTLCSLGIPSCFLHPGEASHGDLGLISRNDILFVASTSGKTREILEIIALAKNIDVNKIIGITSHEDSPIKKQVDVVIDMGIIKEQGTMGLAPTSSILTMLAITDAMAILLSEENNFTKELYGKFHHSGYLGEKAREKSREKT